VKLNLKQAMVAKLDIGPRGAVVTFAPSGFPDLGGLLGYIDRLKGAAKLRPDSKMTIAREWPTAEARLGGAVQLSRGLARVAAASEKKEAA
jgi:transcription-repair coupling factor (superfamily II helicase)